jgi:exodeoxyribonuclease V alpha subunit
MPSLDTTGDFNFHRCGDDAEEVVDHAVRYYRQYPELQLLTPEHKRGAGTEVLNNALQRELNPNSKKRMAEYFESGNYRIYEGDKVLFTSNNYELGLVNGDMGAVVRIAGTGDDRYALVDFDGIGEMEVPRGALRSLTLAYAMTIHKSQGSEWSMVLVVVDKEHRSQRRELLYTAITRTSERLALIGHEEAVQTAVSRERSNNRRTLVVQRMQREES